MGAGLVALARHACRPSLTHSDLVFHHPLQPLLPPCIYSCAFLLPLSGCLPHEPYSAPSPPLRSPGTTRCPLCLSFTVLSASVFLGFTALLSAPPRCCSHATPARRSTAQDENLGGSNAIRRISSAGRGEAEGGGGEVIFGRRGMGIMPTGSGGSLITRVPSG